MTTFVTTMTATAAPRTPTMARRLLLPSLLVLVVLAASTCAQDRGAAGRRPAGPRITLEQPDAVLKFERPEVVLNSSDTLKLRCQSPNRAVWEMPEAAKDHAKVFNFFDEFGYTTTLEIPNMIYKQTGYYKCNDTKKESSIYVYVRDDNNLLVETDLKQIFVKVDEPEFNIPCRPTAPDIHVRLLIDNREAENVSFDPRIGFISSPIGISSPVGISAELECIAENSAKSKQSKAKGFTKVYNPEPVEKPKIKSLRHAILGKEFVLICYVPFDNNHFDLRWDSIPDKQGLEEGRITASEPYKYVDDYGDEIGTNLTIKHVQKKDAGTYRCTSQNPSFKETESRDIIVLEHHESYLNLTSKGNTTNFTRQQGEAFEFTVEYSGHPEPNLTWYYQRLSHDDLTEVPSQINIYPEPEENTESLSGKAEIEYTGFYILEAINLGNKSNVTFYLNVKGGPSHLNIFAEPFYPVNKIATVNCSVLGNPLPIINWSFQPCNNPEKRDTCKESQDLNTSVESGSWVRATSQLTMNTSQSGILRAVAINPSSSEELSKEFKLYVTDVPQGFHLEGSNSTVEGENVEFVCRAAKHLYSKDIEWKFNGHTWYDNSSVHFSETNLSWQSRLQIRNVTKENQGKYTCVSKSEKGNQKEKSLRFNVSKTIPPSIINTNLKGQVEELVVGQSRTLVCRSQGTPAPKIMWFKDKIPLIKMKENLEILQEGTILEFKYLTMEDDGEYICEASSRAGTAKKSIKLSISEKPKVNVALVVGLIALAIVLFIVIVYLFVRVRKEQKLRKRLTKAGLLHFEEGAVENLNMDLGVEDQAELLPYDKKFEFPREKIKLGTTLGSGAFGVVVKAEAFGINEGEPVSTVAVKMVKKTADSTIIKALASELKIMVHLGRHLNVVNLLGACTKGLNKMELLVIVEYCKYGNLHNYLMKHRNKFIDQIDPETGLIDPSRGAEFLANYPNGRTSSHSGSSKRDFVDSRADYRSQSDTSENFATGATDATFVCMTPTGGEEGNLMSNNQPDLRSNMKGDYRVTNPLNTRDLLCYAFQVARGMEYLASRKVLHGDLAARNILLAENNIIKICDFGLAKSVYKDENYFSKGDGPLPIKWMAVESIRDRIFSTQSDVWSFGIVLWEFFTLARTPYPGMTAEGWQLYRRLEEGYRMEKPIFATDDLYTVMMECWQARPILRPSFTELVDRLGSMLEDSVRKHYVDLNEPYIQMNNQWKNESSHSDYLGMFNSPNYSNLMATPEEEETQRYQNIPRGAPTVVADSNLPGYLTMKSPSPTDLNTIFSPTRLGTNEGNIFKFHTPPQGRRQLRDTETNDHVELRPMLSGGSRQSDSTSGHESDTEASSQYTAVPSSRPVVPNTSETRVSSLKPTNQGNLPSFSNPTYSLAPDLVTSLENYVNYPKQRINQKTPELISNMHPPTFSTFGRKPVQEVKLPANYANVPAQRAPLALIEADLEHPYVN